MRIYHVCQCCDIVYKVTEINGTTGTTAGGVNRQGLTETVAGDIINHEPENGNSFASGLCSECRDEVYGFAEGYFQPYRTH